jgi:hypothetical protein
MTQDDWMKTSQPVAEHIRKLEAALSTLLNVCERNDAEDAFDRPSLAEYQAAIAAARKALGRG